MGNGIKKQTEQVSDGVEVRLVVTVMVMCWRRWHWRALKSVAGLCSTSILMVSDFGYIVGLKHLCW